jgi:hypothetical protein
MTAEDSTATGGMPPSSIMTHRPRGKRPCRHQLPPRPSDRWDCFCSWHNCTDFSTQAETQACYNNCMTIVGYDVRHLDDDGIACEMLP